MDSFGDTWSLICDYCKNNITGIAYKAWIERIEPVGIDFESKVAIITVPTDFQKNLRKVLYVFARRCF